MGRFFAVLIGGGIGSVCRYLLQGVVQRGSGGLFPVGTLAVNVVGCLVMGVLGAVFAGPQLVREEARIGLLIGVLGGFTTFSSFAWETLSLLNGGEYWRAAINVTVTNGMSLAAVWLGYRGGVRLFGA